MSAPLPVEILRAHWTSYGLTRSCCLEPDERVSAVAWFSLTADGDRFGGAGLTPRSAVGKPVVGDRCIARSDDDLRFGFGRTRGGSGRLRLPSAAPPFLCPTCRHWSSHRPEFHRCQRPWQSGASSLCLPRDCTAITEKGSHKTLDRRDPRHDQQVLFVPARACPPQQYGGYRPAEPTPVTTPSQSNVSPCACLSSHLSPSFQSAQPPKSWEALRTTG